MSMVIVMENLVFLMVKMQANASFLRVFIDRLRKTSKNYVVASSAGK